MNVDKGGLSFSAIFLIFVLIIISASFSYEPKARLVPLIVGIVILILLLFVLFNEIRPLSFIEKLNVDITKDYRTPEISSQTQETVSAKNFFVIIFWISGFFLFIFVFGFHISIVLFTFTFLKVKGKASWLKALLTAGIVWAAVLVLFELAMGFSLYKGWLFGEIIPPV